MPHVKDGRVPSPTAERRLVPALARGMAIVETVAASSTPMTGADIGRATGLPRTTVHDLVQTLLALGYLRECDPRLHSYTVGGRVLGLAQGYLNGLDASAEISATVRRLSDETGETAQAAVLDGAEVLYVAKSESRNMLRLVSEVGRRLPAHLTGVGKAILAHLPADELDVVYDGQDQLVTMTPHSLGSVDALRAALIAIRRDGLAVDECESNPDVCCVAVPVFDHTGRVVAGLSVSVPLTRWGPAYRDELSAAIRRAADGLSGTLGRS